MDILRILAKSTPQSRSFGIDFGQIVHETLTNAPRQYGGPEHIGEAIRDLRGANLIERRDQTGGFLLTREGRATLADPAKAWRQIIDIPLDQPAADLLCAAARIDLGGGWIDFSVVHDVLDEHPDTGTIYGLLRELKSDGMAEAASTSQDYSFRVKYNGYVWATKRHVAAEFQRVSKAIEDGEGVTTDFKRELTVRTMDQKSEFIKDVIALANTQARGERFLIIGLNDDGTYFAPPDPEVDTERIQQIINRYSSPPVPIRYEEMDHPIGKIGVLEVTRNPTALPHRFAKDMNGKTPRKEGEWFVRHSLHVEHPSDRERELIELEAQRAMV